MNDVIFYVGAAILALLPIGLIVGRRLLLIRANRSVAPKMHIEQRNALRCLGTTSLLLVDISCLRTSHAAHAIAVARRAGIRTCLTAAGSTPAGAAVRLGYAENAREITIVSGKDIHKKSPQELAEYFHGGQTVFSHLTPEGKVHLVTQARQQGEIVTVVTSSIEDVIPLEYASVGIATGALAKTRVGGTADILIEDGDITTVVRAIQTGRTLHDTIHRMMLASLTSNATAFGVMVISAVGALTAHIPAALTPLGILIVTVAAGFLPLLFLGTDRAETNPMHRSPRTLAKPIINFMDAAHIAWGGLVAAGLVYANYIWFFERNNIEASYLTAGTGVHMQATGIALLTAIFCVLVCVVQQRSAHGFFNRHQRHNRKFWISTLLSLIIMTAVVQIGWTPLQGIDIFYVACATLAFLTIREFQRHNRKHHRKAVLELHRSLHTKPPVEHNQPRLF